MYIYIQTYIRYFIHTYIHTHISMYIYAVQNMKNFFNFVILLACIKSPIFTLTNSLLFTKFMTLTLLMIA